MYRYHCVVTSIRFDTDGDEARRVELEKRYTGKKFRCTADDDEAARELAVEAITDESGWLIEGAEIALTREEAEMTIPVELTSTELTLLLEALDSHIYWQLSDERYRDSGFVMDPGSDEPEAEEAIIEARRLEARLEQLRDGGA